MTVHTRALGRSGLEVSEIGLGAWQFADPEWSGPDPEAVIGIVDEALRLGVTFVDTAPGYAGGRSEEALGRALEGRRDRVVLCTKVGYWADGARDYSPDRIERSVEESLIRLRTDHLDVLLLHSPPPEVLDGRTAPQYAALQRLKDAGVIRAFGVSLTEDTAEELRTVVETTGSDAVEVRYNALHQEPGSAFAQAADAGVGLIVKVPLESGWLSGRYDAASRFPVGSRARWSPEEIARRAGLVAEFRSLLPEGTTTAHGALRHILAQPEVSTVIPGTRTIQHLRDSVAAGDGTLPAETLDALRRLGRAQERLPW